MLHLDLARTALFTLFTMGFLVFAVVLFAVSTHAALTGSRPASDAPASPPDTNG